MIEMTILNYVDYFHDGSMHFVKQLDNHLEMAMESSQLSPLDMKEGVPLSNFSTLKGKLHFKKVKSITRNGEPVQEMTMEGYENGEIWDFEIEGNQVLLNIDWCSYWPNRKRSGMVSYEIDAEEIFWENIPDLRLPGDFNIQDYEAYFSKGEITRTNFDSEWGDIELFLESTLIPSTEQIRRSMLSSKHTLKGKLKLRYIESITRNGDVIENLRVSTDRGKIVSLEVGYHMITLNVVWTSTQLTEVIEIKAGAISWRSDVE